MICIICGFCCDGTLFLHAHLSPGERGQLPEKIEENSYSKDGKDYFRLPCHYFEGKCKIYDKKKAEVCSEYRCQLLKDFAEGKITLDEAQAIVREALNMRSEIMQQFKSISDSHQRIFFKQLLRELGKILELTPERKQVSMDYDLLLTRCNIFEALLIKHFSPRAEFEKMIMK